MSIKTRILKELENESIEILRETAVGFRKPVMMYSIGKDSTVLLHLARKAFYPAPIPFPLLHIDTTWKFKEMISFRDRVVAQTNSNLIVYTNQAGVDANINPFTTGISEYTRVMKTVALREALDADEIDAQGSLSFEDSSAVSFGNGVAELKPEILGDHIMFHDGNDRSMERLMQRLSENVYAFRAASQLIRGQFDLINSAIRERP